MKQNMRIGNIAASLFLPEDEIKSFLIIASATGVLRRYYDAFANFANDQGVAVISFDYRGIGDSIASHVKAEQVNAQGWVEDLQQVLEYVVKHHHDMPITILGHSIGGQLMGLLKFHENVVALVSMASQSGYWRNWPLYKQAVFAFPAQASVQVLSRSLGYFPAKKLGLFEDLPKGMALEWSRWCLSKNYFFDHIDAAAERYAAWQCPHWVYHFSDDKFAPKKAVDVLHGYYQNTQQHLKSYQPKDLGLKSIGHFAFFKQAYAQYFWQELVDWLVLPTAQKQLV